MKRPHIMHKNQFDNRLYCKTIKILQENRVSLQLWGRPMFFRTQEGGVIKPKKNLIQYTSVEHLQFIKRCVWKHKWLREMEKNSVTRVDKGVYSYRGLQIHIKK